MTCCRSIQLCSVTILAFVLLSQRGSAETVDWIRQLGKASSDSSFSVTADGANGAYIAGVTFNSLARPLGGGSDPFVARYDAAGNLLWTQQFGSDSSDFGTSVSADHLGSIYVGGWTDGVVGDSSAGGEDAFVSKFNASGTMVWSRQFGTTRRDQCLGISADAGGSVFVTGSTTGDLNGTNAGQQDAFVSKYNASGNLLWSRQLGTNLDDVGRGVSADGLGNVYVTGSTLAVLGGPPVSTANEDAFLAKYDAAGNLLWTSQFGSPATDRSNSVSADPFGNVYIAGETQGDLAVTSFGGSDAFVSKYDSSGNPLWTRQFGTSDTDDATGVSIDGAGNIFVTGASASDLAGPSAGEEDAFVSKFDASGNLSWSRQLGSSDVDQPWSISADGNGSVYFSGITEGNFGGINAGARDAFVGKISEAPEPSCTTLLLLSGLAIASICPRRQ